MNESPTSFDDLALFLAVAECGSLTQAATSVGASLPTLSRRMTRLEQEAGRTLFLRGKAGYALTADGRALAEALGPLHDVSHAVAQWRDTHAGPAPVRITAGIWTSRHLVRCLPWQDTPDWLPIFVPSNSRLDLARREADIGLRNAPPDHSWLARQKLRRITYAIYATTPTVTGFVSMPKAGGLPPSQAWLHDTYGDQISATATDMRLCLDMACAGHGQIVLPEFVGAAEPTLNQRSDPIAALAHDEWLVSHHEARNDPPIRAALTAIATALTPR